ncbi:MAG: polyphenol oxidase family protein [Treponema sp.]|jgi:YfiH family protein|nr:polyphenol oxidase family protein [Treponema sp.]
MTIYPFNLRFDNPAYAEFSVIFEGRPVPELRCVISSRSAGSMGAPGTGNAPEGFYRSLGLDPERVAALRQVHSRTVFEARRGRLLRGARGDGLVAAGGGIALQVTAADCLPVFLWDTEQGCCGLVHSGWRGTGIVLNALALMKERWGTRPEKVGAVLGPCIRSCCYRVDRERAGAFEAEFGPPGEGGEYPLGPVAGTATDPAAGGEASYLDLQAANARLLARAGVRHAAVCGDCTFTDERLGSYRREGPAYTRMAALLIPPRY